MIPGKNPAPVTQAENGQKGEPQEKTQRKTITKELSIFVHGKDDSGLIIKMLAYIYIVTFSIFVSHHENVSVIG